MKKYIITFALVLVFFVCELSGCTQNSNNKARTMEELYDLVSEHSEKTNEYVRVSGTIKNTAGQPVEWIEINALFYDKNGNYLTTKNGDIYGYEIPDGSTADFSLELTGDYYIERYDHYTLEIRVPNLGVD